MSKEGSTIGGLMDSLGTAISVALQYGVPIESLVTKFAHQRFEPIGMTTNRDIPFAKSLVDYIFRWMGMEFIPGYREANAPARSQPASPPAGASYAAAGFAAAPTSTTVKEDTAWSETERRAAGAPTDGTGTSRLNPVSRLMEPETAARNDGPARTDAATMTSIQAAAPALASAETTLVIETLSSRIIATESSSLAVNPLDQSNAALMG